MLTVRKATMVFLAVALLAVGACATYQYEGAAAGGAVGGAAGALLDDNNPWRGGLIGAALGAIFGATMPDPFAQPARVAFFPPILMVTAICFISVSVVSSNGGILIIVY